jgi:hypothetical protein
MAEPSIAPSSHDQAARAARRCAIVNVAIGGAILGFVAAWWATGTPLYWQVAAALLTAVPVMISEIRRWLRLRQTQHPV